MLDILHALDGATTPEAFDQLTLLVGAGGDLGDGVSVRHRFAALGPRDTLELARQAGIDEPVTPIPSAGWADPTGWRGLRRRTSPSPQILQVWGMSAVVAAAVSYAGRIPCVGVFTEPPAHRHRRLLRMIDRPGWQWVALSEAVAGSLVAGGLGAERVASVPAAVSLSEAQPPEEGVAALRLALGIGPDEGPVILLAGDGPRARHDYGMWAAAILHQLYPQTRILVREDPRGRTDPGVERFRDSLTDPEMLAIAPASAKWSALVQAADLVLATPTEAMGTGAVLAAMAAGKLVVGTPVPCITELIVQDRTGLIARAATPRALAARLEEYMSDAGLAAPLTQRARAHVEAHHGPSQTAAAFLALYQQLSPAPLPV